jgi:hypothetical protein
MEPGRGDREDQAIRTKSHALLFVTRFLWSPVVVTGKTTRQEIAADASRGSNGEASARMAARLGPSTWPNVPPTSTLISKSVMFVVATHPVRVVGGEQLEDHGPLGVASSRDDSLVGVVEHRLDGGPDGTRPLSQCPQVLLDHPRLPVLSRAAGFESGYKLTSQILCSEASLDLDDSVGPPPDSV